MDEINTSRRRPANMGLFSPIFFVLCGTSLLCVLLLAVRAGQVTNHEGYRFLLWNLFLAWLPLLVSMATTAIERFLPRRSLLQGFFLLIGCAGWLVLYPNAPYLTTDFIHLIASPDYNWTTSAQSMLVWYDLVVFFLFAWCGLLLGYLSMYQFHRLVHKYLGGAAGWLFILAASFLGGFGVYLGRAIRLNSWDLLFSPFRLISGVLEGLDDKGVIFTILFGMLILIVYLSLACLRLLAGMKREEDFGSKP